MNNKPKLELTWIGKNNPEYDIANIEPRILEERVDLSYGDTKTENMIIHGDNLLALKALLPEFEGKIKCIYIDPPYNTGSAFEQYDDSVEHSTWLSLMKPRLELLLLLLHPEQGSIWISVDDNETHYLKVLCDEILGRNNFIANVVWQKKYTIANDAKWFSDNHDHILIYAKQKTTWRPNKLPRTDEMNARYRNPDNHPKGAWKPTPLHAKSGSESNENFSFKFKNGVVWSPPAGTYPRFSKETLSRMDDGNEIWFGKDGTAKPSRKTFLSELSNDGTPCPTVWLHSDAGNNHEAREETKSFNEEDPFSTPKPEKLLYRIIHLATNFNDLVLDSFLGSGTTAAVAHKMGRKYIGIEMGEHAYTHCKVRLDKVIDGEDLGGISVTRKTLETISLCENCKEVLCDECKAKVGSNNKGGEIVWKGGGGYKFYELAPSFVAIDEFGNSVIDVYYNDIKLIRAMCKLTNYIFAPSPADYWKHGKGQGNNSLYITTQMLSVAMVQQIASHLGPHETLLICPKKFEPGCKEVDLRITIKKIPQSILKASQFGKKQYLLPIKERTIEEIGDEEFTDETEIT